MQCILTRCARSNPARKGALYHNYGQRLCHATPAWRAQPANQKSFPKLDLKWRARWRETTSSNSTASSNTASNDESSSTTKEKMYVLPMFPYPSGTLHMGHFRVYTISDVLSRFHRMQGHEVMHPIGWDAFGLPAENAARDRGRHPADWTYHNIQEMWKQLEKMNGCWDTERELATCDTSFYKHTQQLFLLLHERGLAYQADAMVNYDPVDKTVLANEQVDANGFSWRSGAKVEKKMLRQWFFKISEFRQELLDDLDHLAKDGAWPERVLTMQRNWLGKSTGARIKFSAATSEGHGVEDVEVFTTRPDTLFGVQYLALSSTHPLVQKAAKSDAQLKEVLTRFPSFPDDSKFGYKLKNLQAINPLASESGAPDTAKSSIPIYVAPYVLGDYGGGAVMGVPGHDARDHAFWTQNLPNSPIRSVIRPQTPASPIEDTLFTGKGILASNNGSFSGKTSQEATSEIVALLSSQGRGSASDTWRLRDWLVSRQRYWGTPIPIIHCSSCGAVPVPPSDLPIELPKGNIDWTKSNGAELFEDPSWLNVPCPKCDAPAKRETDTMDTFVDSSWYFMRFPDPKNEEQPFSTASANENLPVDLYIGGVEHAILHLLYARFIAKFLSTTSYWPGGSSPGIKGEPFRKVLTQGMVHGKTYSSPDTGKFLKPDEIDLSTPSQPMVVATGQLAKVSYEKMSKSKYNGVDPTECVEKHGADVTRAHMLFQAPVSDVLEWDEEKISGVRRWFNKLFDLVDATAHITTSLDPKKTPFEILTKQDHGDLNNLDADKALWRQVQTTIQDVTESYSKTFALNTVVSDLMTLTNAIQDHQSTLPSSTLPSSQHSISNLSTSQIISHYSTTTLLKLLAPIAPAICEELWESLYRSTSSSTPSIHLPPFPIPDSSLPFLSPKTQTCAIQINGKVKHTIELPIMGEETKREEMENYIVEEIQKDDEARARLIEGRWNIRNAKKIIVVGGGKVVNFVVK